MSKILNCKIQNIPIYFAYRFTTYTLYTTGRFVQSSSDFIFASLLNVLYYYIFHSHVFSLVAIFSLITGKIKIILNIELIFIIKRSAGAKPQNFLFDFSTEGQFRQILLSFSLSRKLQKFRINKLNRFAKPCFVFQPLTLIRLFKHILCNFN